MELDQQADEQAPKKYRHRKKLLYNSILQQMEFYFSDSNLNKDRLLGQLTRTDPYVELSVFLKFNKIRKLTVDVEHIAKALRKSELLELSKDKTKVKRKTPVKPKENVDECTIYVEKIKPDATHDWLSSIFSEFGTVVYISIPKYKHNKVNKGFAFVEFKSEGEAKQALEHFEAIGCKMSSQMSPEELCSVAAYEREKLEEDENETNGGGGDDEDDAVEKPPDEAAGKRKRSDDFESCDEAHDVKKLRGDEAELNESNAENEDGDDKKKKKTKKAKKKPSFKELGLQILSKHEWRKMRNRYLDMQKKKMKQLKQFLNKRKFSSARFDEYRQKGQGQDNSEKKEAAPKLLQFVPGVIVKLRLPEACSETKKLKTDLKSQSDQIKFVDLQVGSDEAYLRFADDDSAKKFCGSNLKGGVLEAEEEQAYWQKIHESNTTKNNKDRQKQRGRDKLLKKAERELGKHIRFDDTD